MKKVFKIFAGIFLVVVLMGAGGLFYITRGLEEGKHVVIEEVNMAAIEDGVYTGDYQSGRWTNTVEVEIRDNQIINIHLIDGFTQQDTMENVYDSVIEHQTLQVDTVSGATVSSKAYLKAIEHALTGQ